MLLTWPTQQVNSASCGSPGHCAAGGLYSDTPYTYQAFIVNQSQHGGTWGKARRPRPGLDLVSVVPGTGQLRRGRVLHRQRRPRAGIRGLAQHIR
jgi:hypothetical protein